MFTSYRLITIILVTCPEYFIFRLLDKNSNSFLITKILIVNINIPFYVINMLKLEIEKGEADSIILPESAANEMNIDTGDVVIIRNPVTQRGLGGIAEVDSSISSDVVKINETSYEPIGLDEGFEVELDTYDEDFKTVTDVEFGIEPTVEAKGEEDPLSMVKEHEDEFLSFLDNKIFNNNSKFYWDEMGLLISIKSTLPELEGNQLARFGDMEEFAYGWGGSELKTFDGVLLIDVSGSMKTEDMQMEEIDWAIERMGKSLSGPFCDEFLNQLKGRENIRRYEGAAMCALVYLVQKIGRGVGDKVSVIVFSDEPEIINFEGKQFFSSGVGDTSSAAENIVKNIENAEHEHTNLSGAIEQAIEAMKNFDRKDMKMIVTLTDGKPFPARIDDADQVKDVIDKRLRPRKDIIINTIGLGGKVNHDLLEYMADQTGGRYNNVNSLQELTETYSRYAREISVKGSTNK